MNRKKPNQDSTSSPLPNHHGSSVAPEAGTPAIRLYDTGDHVYPPAGCDADTPHCNPLGAMLAVAMAAETNSFEDSPGRVGVLIISPHAAQRQLHEALVGDLRLHVSTSALDESGRPQSEFVILDFVSPWCFDSEDIWGRFRYDQSFVTAAFSAARRETILLGDGFEFQQLPAEAALRRKLDELRRAGMEFKQFPSELLERATKLDAPGIGLYLNLKEAHRLIRQEVTAAQKRIIWNLPEVTRGDSFLIQRRPRLDQVLIQPLEPATVRRWEDLGYRVNTDLRGEACIFLDDDLVWLIGSPRFDDFVRPFARVRGRRTVALLAALYKLREFFTPTSRL